MKTQATGSSDGRRSAVKEMIRRGKVIYWKMPAPLRWPLYPVKMVIKLLDIVRPDVWVMTGNETSSGQKLGVIYAGLEINKNYIRMLAFGDCFQEQHLGRHWLWAVRKVHDKQGHDCSLLVVETPHCSARLSAKLNYLYIPGWVTGEMDLAKDQAEIFRSRNKSLQSDIRRIRKHNLHFELTRNLLQLHNFYHNMYIPYTIRSHGDRSKIMTYGYIKAEFKKRGLFTDLMLNNPFIYKNAKGLEGAVFLDGDKPLSSEDFEDIYKKFYAEGLSKLVIYRFDGAADADAPVPPPFAGRMIIAPAQRLFAAMR